jgi:hypothetical protein
MSNDGWEGVNHPCVEPSSLTSAREITPHATSQEEKGMREKQRGRREGKKRNLEKHRVSDIREGGE